MSVVTLSTGDLAACRRFYCGVLQMRELPEVGSAAEVSGLNATQARLWALPPHTPIRYVTMFARGSNSSNVAFLDFGDSGRKNPAPLGPPSRGLVMWSFRVRDLDEALARVRARGLEVVCEPLRLQMPSGTQAVATVRAPNGFLVELVGDPPQEPVVLSGTVATRAPAARSR